MTIITALQDDIKNAMRAQDKAKLSALRLIAAAIKQIEVDERITVNDERLLSILAKLAKQRKESIAQFKIAKRDDLVEQEQFELDLIEHYLPKQLADSEVALYINDAITATGAKVMADMGKVMAILKPKLQGQADMAKVSALVKAKLS